MSQETTYKWKYKRDKNRNTKPYERPKNESLVSTVTAAIKDKMIPNWLKGVANYLVPSNEEHVEATVNENASTSAHCVASTSEPSVAANELQRDNSEPSSVFKTSERLSRSALNNPADNSRSDPATINSQPLIANRVNEATMDEEGSSTTSNTASSTSGCSSLVPSHQEHLLQRLNFPVGKSSLESLRKELMKKTRDVAIETESKQPSSENASQMPSFLWSAGGKRKADFSISSFFAPNSVINAENKSPFYEGRTTFGGASGKRARLAASSPYTIGTHKIPSIVRVKAKESKTVESSLSNTAKRILESMEKMSSPLEDAKKLPSYKEVESKHLIINPIKQFRKSIPGRISSTFSFNPVGHKPDNETNTSSATNQPSTEALQPTNEDKKERERNVPSGGKIRTSVTKVTARKVNRIDDVIEEISLPNAPLPIKSLPSFSFKKDIEQKSAKNVHLPKPTTNITRVLELDGEKEKVREFKFTAPLLPRQITGSNNVDEVKSDIRTVDHNGTSTKIVEKVTNNSEEYGNQIKPVNDITIKKSETVDIISKDEKPMFKSSWNWTNVNINSWSCPVCMIQNSNDKLKCAACEACKPGCNDVIVAKKSNPTKENDITTKVFDSIAPQTKNESKPDEGAKKNNSETNSEKMKSNWGSKFAAPANTWECDTCLVRNKAADSKCIACETPKTSTQDKSALNKAYSGFNFGKVDTSNNAFVPKFGIPQNDKPVSTTEASDTPKKVTFNIQSEGFGAFSNTSPTYSMTTTSTAVALTTTTGSQFNFGSLSSPKSNSISLEETVAVPKPVEKSEKPTEFKIVSEKPATLAPVTTTTVAIDGPKLSKEETSSSTPSLFTFGASTAKSSEGFAFKKKADVEKTEVKTGNFVFGKPAVQNSPFSLPAATTTSSSTFASFSSENKPTVTKPLQNSTDFRYQSVFESAQKSEGSEFTKTAVTSAAAVTSTASSLLTNTTNTQSGFKFSFGLNNNSLAKPVTNSESTSIPTTTTVTSKTTAFSFGASSAKSSAEPFSFSNELTSQPAGSGGFKFPFGTNSPLNTSGFTPSSATSAALQTTSSTAAPTTTSSGGFTFGSMLNTSKVVNPSFTFGSPSQPVVTTTATATPSFNFNEKPASVFSFTGTAKNSSLQPPSSFSFDQRQSTPQNFASTTSPFVFGSQPANTPINTMSQGFNFNNNSNTLGTEFKPAAASFGQNSMASPQFNFGQPANQQPASSGLTFGAPAVPSLMTPQPQMPINFSQTPNINFSGQASVGQPGGVFQFNANTTENPLSSGIPATRNIKKAKRRLGPT